MNYEVLEADVVTKLNTVLSATHTVVPIPENEEDFKKPFAKTRITVGYSGSEAGVSKSINDIVQEEEIELMLLIESRFLRDDYGIYWTLKKCKSLLINFRDSNGNTFRFKMKNQKLVGMKDGVKQWEQVYSCMALVVTDEEEESGPPISEMTFQTSSV